MKKGIKWLVGSLAVAAIAVIGTTSAVFAAGNGALADETPAVCDYGAGMQWGNGWGVKTLSELTGLSQEEIRTQRQSGQSLLQIAEANGITQEQLVNAVMEQAKVALQAKVDAGTLTQEQMELRIATMTERITANLNRTSVGPGENAFGKNGSNQGQGSRMRNQNADGTCLYGDGSGTGSQSRFGQGRAR